MSRFLSPGPGFCPPVPWVSVRRPRRSKGSARRSANKRNGVGRFLDPREMVARFNRMLRGWANYFCLGAMRAAYRIVDTHACFRLRQWLGRRERVQGLSRSRYSQPYLQRTYGAGPLEGRRHQRSCANAWYLVREPDAGNPHVRFDERGVEPGHGGILGHRQPKAPATHARPHLNHRATPRLYSLFSHVRPKPGEAAIIQTLES
jgi:hypothetical protein